VSERVEAALHSAVSLLAAKAAPLTAEALFTRYFLPLYPPGADLAALRKTDANPANNPHILAQLDAIAATFAKLAPDALGVASLDLDYSDASVHRLAAALTRDVANRLVAKDESGTLLLVQVVTHGAIYLGACAVRNHGGRWQVRTPLWESRVELTSRAGVASLSLFQWWLKALTEDEIGEPRLADRYRMHVELPTASPEALPLIADPTRRMPRLTKVRYDTLYQHLRAHLPELVSVGDHFPSAERFAELGFHWLDFVWLGGGRMLLLHGPSDRGVHLFWLDRSGFVSSAFYPADAFPEHHILLEDDKLCVEVPILGQTQRHEMLWWGPSG
jgi:hypothetical protein